MSIMFINISTSGLPKDGAQPWICWIAASLCDTSGKHKYGYSVPIRAEGRFIEAGAERSHGVTSKMAEKDGIYEMFAIGSVCGLKAGPKREKDYPCMASGADVLVAWDPDFVKPVISAAFARHWWVKPDGMTCISIRDMARKACALPDDRPGATGFKIPNRDQAARVLFGAEPRPLPHTADSNLDLERRIYFELHARGEFKDET